MDFLAMNFGLGDMIFVGSGGLLQRDRRGELQKTNLSDNRHSLSKWQLDQVLFRRQRRAGLDLVNPRRQIGAESTDAAAGESIVAVDHINLSALVGRCYRE